MTIQDDIKNVVHLPSSVTRMLVKRQLQNNYFILVEKFVKLVLLKVKTGNFAKSDWMDIENNVVSL